MTPLTCLLFAAAQAADLRVTADTLSYAYDPTRPVATVKLETGIAFDLPVLVGRYDPEQPDFTDPDSVSSPRILATGGGFRWAAEEGLFVCSLQVALLNDRDETAALPHPATLTLTAPRIELSQSVVSVDRPGVWTAVEARASADEPIRHGGVRVDIRRGLRWKRRRTAL